MLINKIINNNLLGVVIVALISYYFAPFLSRIQLVVAFILLVIFFIFFLKRVEYAFCIILATRSIIDIYFYNIQFAGQQVPQIAGTLVTLLIIYYILASRFNIFSLGINKIYGWFMLFSFFPVFFNENLVAGFGYWLRWLQGFFILNITVMILLKAGTESYKKKINMICISVILSLVLPYVLFINNYIYGKYLVLGGYARYALFGATFNVFSYYLLAVFPFCIFLYSEAERNSKKIFWLIFLAIMLYTVYLTYTRTVWIAVTTILFMWAVMRKYYGVTFFVLFLGSLIILTNPSVQDRLRDILIILTSNNDFFSMDSNLLSKRIGLWQTNLRYFIHESTILEKLVGNGTDVLRSEVVRLIKGTLHSGVEHNNYLFLLMNTGIIGLLLYLTYILRLFQESFRLIRETQDSYLNNLAGIFISVLFSFVIIGITTHTLLKITFVYDFSVFAGFIVAANLLEKKKNIITKT